MCRRRRSRARGRHRGLSIWGRSEQAPRALRSGWSSAVGYCCTWSGADVFPGRSDPDTPVWRALRHEEVVQRTDGAGIPRAGMQSTGWHAVGVHQPARHTNARFVFRSLWILYLGKASRGGKVYCGLVSGTHPRDGLDDIEAPVGRDRAGEVAQAVSTGAEQK